MARTIVVCGAILVAALPGWGQEVQPARIAVVDFKGLLAQHPEAIRIEAALENRRVEALRQLEEKRNEARLLAENARQIQQAGLDGDGALTPEAENMLMDLRKQDAELRQTMRQLEYEVQEKLIDERREAFAKLTAALQAAVRETNSGRYDLVLDASAISRAGFPQVLDHSGVDDLTKEVMAFMAAQGGF